MSSISFRAVTAACMAAVALTAAGCSDSGGGSASSTTTSKATTTAKATTSAKPTTTAAVRPTSPRIPDNVSPEPSTEQLPDGTYLSMFNSYDNIDDRLNLNLVAVDPNVVAPDGTPYFVDDADPFTLRDLPLADGAKLFLLPDGGGWEPQQVTDRQTFFSALANRAERPTPYDANQNSVFAVSVVAGEISQVWQVFLP